MENILNMFSLEGKNVIITGGCGVLGTVISEGLAKAGASVAICDIKDTSTLVNKLLQSNLKVKGYYIDVLNKNKIESCCEEILKDFSTIDILVNMAGGNIKESTTSQEVSFFDLPLEGLQKVVALNLFGGAILPCQVFGKVMANNADGGAIINVSSMAAFRPLTRVVGYSAAKSAVSNFTQWLATYFAMEYNKNLRVNAIAPGFFLTEQNRYLLLDKTGNLTARGKSIIEHTPMGRFGNPDELVGACIWLASAASKFVTGTVIVIDGGFNAYSGV